MRILGCVLVKDEDIYIRQSLLNIMEFCDEILLLDNMSEDHTWDIAQELASQNPKLKTVRISDMRESHYVLEAYAGTPTWVFAVDGDEIYDPGGLSRFRHTLNSGQFDDTWRIYGNVLNCISLDPRQGRASGYLAPPARPMTKLYNFEKLLSWTGCSQRLHDGIMVFPEGYDATEHCIQLHLAKTWEETDFRCLHMALMRRSSRQNKSLPRLSPSDQKRSEIASRNLVSMLAFRLKCLKDIWRQQTGKDQAYRRGEVVTKEVQMFFNVPGIVPTHPLEIAGHREI
jgi:hypothetical protein